MYSLRTVVVLCIIFYLAGMLTVIVETICIIEWSLMKRDKKDHPTKDDWRGLV